VSDLYCVKLVKAAATETSPCPWKLNN